MANNAMFFQQLWYHICFILGLSGNLFVLHGSIAHKAIKLDVMSQWIIKNLAFVDVLNCISVLLPMMLCHYAGNVWIFGDFLCEISAIFRFIFTTANIFLINALSINKLHRCFYPLENLVPSRKRRIFVTTSSFIFSLIPSLSLGYRVMKESAEVIFHPYRLICEPVPFDVTTSEFAKTLTTISLMICVAVPNLMLIVSNAVLIGYATKKTNTRVNKLNILIVIFVTATFLVSFLPMFAVFFWKIHGTFRDFAWSAVFLSSWSNPFIYLAVNPRFRAYTKSRVKISRGQKVDPGGWTSRTISLSSCSRSFRTESRVKNCSRNASFVSASRSINTPTRE